MAEMMATVAGDVGSVAADYVHHQREIKPNALFRMPRVELKWYDIYHLNMPIPEALQQKSRAFLQDEIETGNLEIDDNMGFVMLHQCMGGVFILVATWRNNNELWKTVYEKDTTPDGDYSLMPVGRHVHTYCVWELGAVWHEQQAWGRYLYSSRDAAARQAYLRDQFAGLI